MKYKLVSITASYSIETSDDDEKDPLLRKIERENQPKPQEFQSTALVVLNQIINVIDDSLNNACSIYMSNGDCVVCQCNLQEFIKLPTFEL